MTALTHDEIQCDTKSLARWVADIVAKPRIGLVLYAYVVTSRSLVIAQAAQKCLYACPAVGEENGPPCLSETIATARYLAKELRRLSKGFGIFTPIIAKKISRAIVAWEGVAEDAEDIRDMLAAMRDSSPGIPLEQLMAELDACPTQ